MTSRTYSDAVAVSGATYVCQWAFARERLLSVSGVLPVLDLCTRCLHKNLDIIDADTGDVGGVDDAVLRLLDALMAVLALLRNGAADLRAFLSVEARHALPGGAAVTAASNALRDELRRAIEHESQLHRAVLRSAALAVMLLADVVWPVDTLIRTKCLRRLLLGDNGSSGGVDDGVSASASVTAFAGRNAAARMAMALNSAVVHVELLFADNACLLLDCLLPDVLSVSESDNEASTQTLAFQALQLMIETVGARSVDTLPALPVLETRFFAPIERVLLTSWDSVADGASESLQHCFRALLDVHARCAQHAAAETDAWHDALCARVAQSDPRRRSKLEALTMLLARVGAAPLLRVRVCGACAVSGVVR
jgi:hypothetical protein